MVALSLVLATALVGCAPTASGPAPTTPAPSASPSQVESTDEAIQTAETVVVSSTGFSILDQTSQEMASFDYFVGGEIDLAVVELTEAFGSEPVIGEFDVSPHGPMRTTYTWGGFQLQDTNLEPTFPDTEAQAIVVTSSEVNGVSIQGSERAAVGGSGTSLAGSSHFDRLSEGEIDTHFYLLDETVVEGHEYADYLPAALSVRVWSDPSTDRIIRIDAPTRNWGA